MVVMVMVPSVMPPVASVGRPVTVPAMMAPAVAAMPGVMAVVVMTVMVAAMQAGVAVMIPMMVVVGQRRLRGPQTQGSRAQDGGQKDGTKHGKPPLFS
jgi:hypothetical protein